MQFVFLVVSTGHVLFIKPTMFLEDFGLLSIYIVAPLF
jgi:hypothetical protein